MFHAVSLWTSSNGLQVASIDGHCCRGSIPRCKIIIYYLSIYCWLSVENKLVFFSALPAGVCRTSDVATHSQKQSSRFASNTKALLYSGISANFESTI